MATPIFVVVRATYSVWTGVPNNRLVVMYSLLDSVTTSVEPLNSGSLPTGLNNLFNLPLRL